MTNAWVEFALAVRELALRIFKLWPALFYGEHSRLAQFKWVMRLHAFLELRNWDGDHAGRCLGCMKALAAAMMVGRCVAADAGPSEREAMHEAATRLVEVAARVKGHSAAFPPPSECKQCRVVIRRPNTAAERAAFVALASAELPNMGMPGSDLGSPIRNKSGRPLKWPKFWLPWTLNFQNPVSPGAQRRADTPPAFGPVFVRPARRLSRFTSGPSVAGCPVATFRPKG